MKYVIGIFYILHGLVHLLYMGHSFHYFSIEKDFAWPGNSKFLANTFNLETKKAIAGILCAVSAVGFAFAGICILVGHTWKNLEVIVAVIISTVLFIAFWDGSTRKLHTQGGIAILINMLILAYTFMYQ